MKKEIAAWMVIVLIAVSSSAFMFSQALGWAVSIKQDTWSVKALCTATQGTACESAQFAINPEGYIESKSLGSISQASPELGKAITATINPQGFVTTEALKQVAKDNPESAGSLGETLNTMDQLKALGVNQGHYTVGKEGEISEASFTTEKNGEIGNLVGKDVKKEEVEVSKGMKLDKKEGITTLTFTETNCYAKIRGKVFMNVKQGDDNTNAYIKLDEKGEVVEGDITAAREGTYEFGEKKIQAEEDTRIVYKEGVIEIHGKDKNVKIDEYNVRLNGEKIKAEGDKITGEDFTLNTGTADEARIRGVEKSKAGEATVNEYGYILGKNTVGENSKVVVTSEQGALFMKSCQDSSGLSKYVSTCGQRIAMDGEGFSVQVKEGKNFGLDIEKDDILKYEMKGGKVVIAEGEQTILPKEKGMILVTNGASETKYTKVNGVTQELVNPENIGEYADVSITSAYAMSKDYEIVSATDEDSGTCTEYVCPVGGAGEGITGRGILDDIKCKISSVTNKGNKLIGVELGDYGVIRKEYPAVEYSMPDGRKGYSKMFETDKGKFMVTSDGGIYKCYETVNKQCDSLGYTTPEAVKSLGIPQSTDTKKAGQEDPGMKMEKIAQTNFNKALENSRQKGLLKEGEFFAGAPEKGGFMYLQPAQGTNFKNADYLLQKRSDGKFENLDGKVFEIVDRKRGIVRPVK